MVLGGLILGAFMAVTLPDAKLTAKAELAEAQKQLQAEPKVESRVNGRKESSEVRTESQAEPRVELQEKDQETAKETAKETAQSEEEKVSSYSDVYMSGIIKGDPARRIYLTESGGYYYFMLPSGAEVKSAVLGADLHALIVDGKEASSSILDLTGKEDLTLRILGTDGDATIKASILKLSKLPAVFIDTKSGSMEQIDASEKHTYKEPGVMLVLDEKGNANFAGELKSIKGRGNFTWGGNKKPYNIKLSKSSSILGMDKGKSYCLLANYFDATRLRNEVIYDMAEALGGEFSMDGRSVDVYLNGVYNGVYYLTEKVEVGSTRIDIADLEEETQKVNDLDLEEYPLAGVKDFTPGTCMYSEIPNNPKDITGGYVLELEYKERYAAEAAGFVTSRGLCVTFKAPEYATREQVEYMSSYFQDFEDAVYSPTGKNSKGIPFTAYVDLEDMAIQYLLQEFAQNRDAIKSSFYLYKDSDQLGDGKLHATTAWDFDMSLGNSGDDLNFTYDTWVCASRPNVISQLAKWPQMQIQLVTTWNEKFRPYVSQLLDGGLEEYYDGLKGSLAMDAIKWPNYLVVWYREEDTYSNEYQKLTEYMQARFDFVNASLHNGDVFGANLLQAASNVK